MRFQGNCFIGGDNDDCCWMIVNIGVFYCGTRYCFLNFKGIKWLARRAVSIYCEESEGLILRRINIGYFYAIATGVVSGLVPVIFQKAIGQEPIPRTTGLFVKLVASSFILLPLAIPKMKKVQIPRHFYWKLPVCSLLYIATLVLLYESYNHIPTGISISLHYTFPLFTMVLSALFFRFRSTKQGVAAMLLSIVGVALLSSGSLSAGGSPIGIALAIGSALAYAVCFLWIEREKLTALDTTVFVTIKTCGAAIFLIPYILLTNGLTFSMSTRAFCGLLLSGVFTILASVFLTIAIRHIGSVHTSILTSLEPIVCAIAGVMFLGERVSMKSGVGIIMVLAATILVTLSKQSSQTEMEK